MNESRKIIIGWREKVELIPLGIKLTAKVDTGAYTSALSVSEISEFKLNGKKMVCFKYKNKLITTPLICRKKVKSSNGSVQLRPVIKSDLVIGEQAWEIQITLTNRALMKYPMLLGRKALSNRCIVDVSYSNLTKHN